MYAHHFLIKESCPISNIRMADLKDQGMEIWLLCYCILCLVGILKNLYLEYVSILIHATFSLLQKPVSRVVNAWNALDDEVVAAPSVTIFKKKLDAFMDRQK
ncbi:unnamed protein product, partial [Darwinula stevensoni]